MSQMQRPKAVRRPEKWAAYDPGKKPRDGQMNFHAS
jgi:hypothetical protein